MTRKTPLIDAIDSSVKTLDILILLSTVARWRGRSFGQKAEESASEA